MSIYTSALYFSKEKERELAADWNPSLSLLVLRAPGFLELRALLCRSLKVRTVAAEKEQAAGCSLRCETRINSGSQATALSTGHLHGLHDNVCPTRCQWLQDSCGASGCDFLHPPATLLTGEFVRAQQYILNQTPQQASTPYLKWYNSRAQFTKKWR